ncbi:MAG: PEP-utilizing enzyme [Acidimicrobiia bacterium]|nr:PEP-utilizing enzyme [Acidimicrobiia bacterium]
MTDRQPRWTPPGPGEWEYDGTHSPPSPTRVFRSVAVPSAETAYRRVFERMGGPLDTIEMRFVNGKLYRRLRPLVGGDSNMASPPAPVLWLAARLHPAFRRRERQARQTFADDAYLQPISEWEHSERRQWVDANQALQATIPIELDDNELAAHVDELIAHNLAGWTRHHELHGTDMGPIGDLLAHTNRWGIDPVKVMETLYGASPATTEAATAARNIADTLSANGVDVGALTDLDQVTAVPEAGRLLDDYLSTYRWRVVTSYDIEGATVGELPSATLNMIKRAGATDAPTTDFDPAVLAAIRAQVPAEHGDDFDEMWQWARRAYGLRDDNGPLTAEWPMGLIRRAYLESGRRLAEAGRIDEAAHVFELDGPELSGVLRGASAPSADELVQRRAERDWESSLEPPIRLGKTSAPPNPAVLPPMMRRMVEAVTTCVELLEPPPTERRPLTGTGIGRRTYQGVARVAHSAEEVIERMEPGDILVAAWTAPTYNAVMAMAGALVVQEGGLLCHAAVMARELDLPAVIGADSAMTDIVDGSLIEVDPVAGAVRVLSTP